MRCCSSRSSSRRSFRSPTGSSSSTRARSSASIRATSPSRRSASRCSVGGSVRPREHGSDGTARDPGGGSRDRHDGGALRPQAAGRWDRRAGIHGRPRVPDRRSRRARHRPQPAARLPGHLQRRRSELDLPSDDGYRLDRRVQPLPDASADDHADPLRAGRGLCIPLRDVQHRRPGAVPRRPVRRQLARATTSPG